MTPLAASILALLAADGVPDARERAEAFAPAIAAECGARGVPVEWAVRRIYAESRFDANAVGRAYEQGASQVHPITIVHYGWDALYLRTPEGAAEAVCTIMADIRRAGARTYKAAARMYRRGWAR